MHLKILVPTIILRISDPHPRVRFIALHCLGTFITEYTGSENENENENENDLEEFTFQKLFPDTPTILCNSIKSTLNSLFPRIVYGGFNCLKSFFNPDVCTKKNCTPFGAGILDLCMEFLQDEELPLFVRGECSSVLGNVSILYSDKLDINKYNKIMTVLKYIILNNNNRSKINENENEKYTQLNHENSLFKGKCLESVALVGKSVGGAIFSPIAHEYLQMFVLSHEKVL